MQSIANGSNDDKHQTTDPNKETNGSIVANDAHPQQNGSAANGISLNGVNQDYNENGIASNGNCGQSITKMVDIKSRTDQDIIRLIGQHLRVLGLKLVSFILLVQ